MTNHRFHNYFTTSYDRDTYYAIRKLSIQKGIAIQDVIRQAVTQYLETEGENQNDYESDERDTKYVSKRKSMFK
jgi:hypothetical protein